MATLLHNSYTAALDKLVVRLRDVFKDLLAVLGALVAKPERLRDSTVLFER